MGRLLLLRLTLLPTDALAHRGGLDRSGGHHDRRTGEYHCHRASCSPRRGEREDEGDRQPDTGREPEDDEGESRGASSVDES